MRCPICNQRLEDRESLQIHCIQDCPGIGDSRSNAGKKEEEHKQQDLVEVDFKWVNTKGTTEENISLISSLAGQILLERTTDEDLYQSAKLVVPCGIHCCQLVIGDDCNPVIDIDIDTMQDSLYVILQADLESSGSNEALDQYQIDTENGDGGSRNYANLTREALPRNRENSATEHQLSEGSRTHDRGGEAQEYPSDVSSTCTNPLTRIASNGFHEALVHNLGLSSPRNSTKDSLEIRRGSEENEFVVGDLSVDERGERDNSMGGVLVPPPGFQSNGREHLLRGSQVRERSLAQHGGFSTRMNPETLSDQLNFEESLAPVEKYKFEKKSVDDEDDEDDESKRSSRFSWSYDEKTKEVPKFKASKSVPYGSQINRENILELEAKCDSYESELARSKKENEDLLNQLLQMQEENSAQERRQAATVSNRLDDLMQENKKLKEENESLKTANTLQLGDMERINKGLMNEVNELTAKVDHLKFGNRSFQEEDSRKMLQLEAEVANFKLENEELKLKLSRIRREFVASQTDVSETKNDYNNKKSPELGRSYDTTSFGNNTDYSLENGRYSDTSHDASSSRENSYTRRSPLEKLHDDTKYSALHEPIIRSSSKPRDYDSHSITRKSMFLDDNDTKYTQRSPRSDYKLDSDYSYLPNHNLTMRRYTSTSAKQRDNTTPDYKAPRSNYSDSHEPRSHTSYAKEHVDARENVDFDSILASSASQVPRREKKTRRERPHSFHGGVTSSSYFEPTSSNHRSSPGRRDSYSSDLDKLGVSPQENSASCFYPSSITEISIGMRALVTRTSGRLGKGLVKWKGNLPGHNESFLGIELENPNGKHDGVYDGLRYFKCKKDHGIFAKFSKVVMVWVPRR